MDTSGIADILSITAPMMAQKQALAEQRDTAIKAVAQALPDDIAASVPLLYPDWVRADCTPNMIVNYNGQLYRVITAPTDDRPPDADGMLAVYRPIVPGHAGTMTDPIPWVYGIDCKAGLHYSYADQIWLCKSDMSPCTWTPGTAPTMWAVVT